MGDQSELRTLNIKPGVNRELTQYAAEGTWYDADKVRFRYGKPEKLGGWVNASTPENNQNYLGVAREMHAWSALDSTKYLGIGTSKALLVWEGGQFYDISPVIATITLTNAISTSAGSTRVVVSAPGHTRQTGDYALFVSASTTVGGNILLVNAATTTRYEVSVIDSDSFAVDANVTAAATSISSGGSITLIETLGGGRESADILFGWGAGVWSGAYPWGQPVQTGAGVTASLRKWSLDSWGELLVACPTGGRIYYWSPTSGTDTRAVVISAAPTINNIIVVSPEDRHLISFGTTDPLGEYDPLYIRWSDQEDFNNWTPTISNTAGGKRLSGSGDEIRAARRTRGQILIWTNSDLYGMAFSGPPFTFDFSPLGNNCGIISQHAHAEIGGRVYWMSEGRFMVFDGAVSPLRCDVLRYVFSGIDYSQKEKIFAGTNAEYNEIIWFYQSTSSTNDENDRYVIYNYLEDVWTIGTMCRSAWQDETIFEFPIAACGQSNGIFYHEVGESANGGPMNAYIESAAFDIKDGDTMMFIDKIVPDFGNDVGGEMAGSVNITVKTKKYPNENTSVIKGPYTITNSTRKISMRARGRQAVIRLESSGTNDNWRYGTIRMEIAEDGFR